MSRSIGDLVAASVGVICEPDITEVNLTEKAAMLIVCSDGVWEFLSNEEVVEMVQVFYRRNDAKGAVFKLIEESTRLWKEEDSVVDDITALVVFL